MLRDRTLLRWTTTSMSGTARTPASAGQRGRGPRPYVAEERDPDRTYCPLCPRNYLQYRSCKHCVLDHHMRYEHRHRRCVAFKSREELETAWAKCKEAQKSGQKRRATGDGSPPCRSVPPMLRQETGRPFRGGRSVDHRAGEQGTRTVILREPDDRRHGPPRQCRSESAITISDDSDSTVRQNDGASRCLRPRKPTPSFPRQAEGRSVSASVSVVSNVGNIDHILGKGVLPRCVGRGSTLRRPRVRVDDSRPSMGRGVGMLGRDRRPGISNAPSNVSKDIGQQIDEQLANATFREALGLECIKFALEKDKKINEGYKLLKEEGEKMEQEKVSQAERLRKPDTEHHSEWDEWDDATEMDRLDALEALEKEKEKTDRPNMSDVEPDDPVPVTVDENANVVKDHKNEIVSDVQGTDVLPPANSEPVIISSDENNDNGKIVDDVDLHEIGMEVAENLRGVVFDVPEDANVVLGAEKPRTSEWKDAFGVHDLYWQPSMAEMFMDITDWTDDEDLVDPFDVWG